MIQKNKLYSKIVLHFFIILIFSGLHGYAYSGTANDIPKSIEAKVEEMPVLIPLYSPKLYAKYAIYILIVSIGVLIFYFLKIKRSK